MYVGLWLCFPAFAALLSYLCIAIGMPLQDRPLAAADSVLGFDWLAWEAFMTRHPLFHIAQGLAYFSLIWQALLSIAILALWRPGHRNPELLTGMLAGILLTLLFATLMPALGPAAMLGRVPDWLPTLLALRSPAPGPLGYTGIITFPSFHTVMAILFVHAHRGIRWTFPPLVVVNLLLLAGIPLWGGHYLIDVVAGAAVALLAILVARRLCPADAACTVTVRAA